MTRTFLIVYTTLALALCLDSERTSSLAAEPEFAVVREALVAACKAKDPPEDDTTAAQLADIFISELSKRHLMLSPDEAVQLGKTLAIYCSRFDSVCRYPVESKGHPIALEIAKTELEMSLELWMAMRSVDVDLVQKASEQTESLAKDVENLWLANLPASIAGQEKLLKSAIIRYRQQRQAMIDDGTSPQFKVPLTEAAIVQWKQRFSDRLAKSLQELEGKLESENAGVRSRLFGEWLMNTATDAVIAEQLTRVELKLANTFQPSDHLKELQNRKAALQTEIAPFERAQSRLEIDSMHQRVKDQVRRKAQEIEDRKAALALEDTGQQLRMQARVAAEEKQNEAVLAERRSRTESPVSQAPKTNWRSWLMIGNLIIVGFVIAYFLRPKRPDREKPDALSVLLIIGTSLGGIECLAGEAADAPVRRFVTARLDLMQAENRSPHGSQRQIVIVLDHFATRLERKIDTSDPVALAEELAGLSGELDVAASYLSQDGIQLSQDEIQALVIPVFAEPLRRLVADLQMEPASDLAIAAVVESAVADWTNPLIMPVQQAESLKQKLELSKTVLNTTFGRYAERKQEFLLERDRLGSADAQSRFDESFLRSTARRGATAIRQSLVPRPSADTRRLTRWLQSEQRAANRQPLQPIRVAFSQSRIAKEHLDSLLFSLVWPQFQH